MTTWMAPTNDTDPVTPWSEGPRLVRQNAFVVDPNEPYNPFDHINSTYSDESSTSILSYTSSTFASSVEGDNDNDIIIIENENEIDTSNIENENENHTSNIIGYGYDTFRRSGQWRQPLGLLFQRRVPLPENTGDYDETSSDHAPQSTTTTSSRFGIWSGNLRLRPILYAVFGVIMYELYACSELQPISPERFHTVDPAAPAHVWVPVIYWSCWRRALFVKYWRTVALGIVAMIVFYWLRLKRRS